MNPDLEKLMNIQHLSDEIQRLKKRCDEIPGILLDFDRQLDSSQKKLDSIKSLIKDNEARIRKCEIAIQDARTQQGKYRTQLFKLKSNREYQALNSEITLLGEKISAFETEIIENMENNDSAQCARKQAEEHLKAEKIRIGEEKLKISSELSEEKRRLEDAQAAYERQRQEMDEEIISQFDRLVRKNGRAVSELHGKNCGNCYVKVRPQIAASVIGNTCLLNCDKCGVYLYSVEKSTE
ncbi:hypothetical protein JW823_04915 [bacterium]|nr:hypothetical protein [candidate division CSSED10-310 bacterium]